MDHADTAAHFRATRRAERARLVEKARVIAVSYIQTAYVNAATAGRPEPMITVAEVADFVCIHRDGRSALPRRDVVSIVRSALDAEVKAGVLERSEGVGRSGRPAKCYALA